MVLEGGGALLVEGFQAQVPAIVMAWYPGVEGGHAIAAVLFGDVSPSGRLPVSFPRGEGQLPPFVNDRDVVTCGYLHGYRHLDAAGEEPRFPFGFGLSYATFSLANLRLDAASARTDGVVQVTVDVTNRGPVAGDEVVQLYVSCPGSAVPRAVRELKGFARATLAPGETRSVTLELAARELAYWDEGRGAFVVEPLTCRLEVGASSRDLPLAVSLPVTR